MTKNELIKEIAEDTGQAQSTVKDVLESAFSAIGDELGGGGEVSIAGFGKFSVAHRAARTGRNPQTGATMQIAASKNAKFKAAKALRDQL